MIKRDYTDEQRTETVYVHEVKTRFKVGRRWMGTEITRVEVTRVYDDPWGDYEIKKKLKEISGISAGK